MLQPEDNSGLPEVQYEYAGDILSDKVFIYIMHIKVWKMTNYHKVTCGSKSVFPQTAYLHHCDYYTI